MIEFHHTLEEVLYSTAVLEGRPEIDVLYNQETKPNDCITNLNGLLKSIRNNRRVFCQKCRQINQNTHKCYGINKEKPRFVRNGEFMFYTYNYALNNEATDFQKDGYIQVKQRKTVPIANLEIYYIDFENPVLEFHKITGEPEPLQEYPLPDIVMGGSVSAEACRECCNNLRFSQEYTCS
jgi:hypothetical protein